MITFDSSLFIGNRNKDPDSFKQLPISDDTTCYICFNSGSPSEPLVSDCSCTGNVAHIKCIANFAAGGVINSSIKDWSGCKDRWMTCTACTKPHQHELSIALAVRLVDFTKKAYPNDGVIIINARILVLREITYMFMSTSQSCYRNKGIEMANDILRRIGQINISDETIRLKIIFAMASVFNSLGDITLGSGTNNSIQQARRGFLRIGLPPKDIVTLVLIFIKIFPNIKLLSASELGMPFLGVVLRNYEFHEGQKLITQVFGGAKLPGVKLVGYPDSELEYKLDAEITIDSEYQVVTNGSNKTTIKKFAESLLKHLRDIEKQNKTVIQIEDGIKSGLSHPKADSIATKVLLVANEVSKHVTDVTLPLDQQPHINSIDELMDNEITAKLPITIGNKKYVIIYLRYSTKDQNGTVFKLAAEQFTICYAAGVARKLINKKTELIIIFDNGRARDGSAASDGVLNSGLATAFAYICDGTVIAFISSTSIRCTNIRVLFKCLQRTCKGCETQYIAAQHSSELAAVIMEYEFGRVVANKIRYNTFDVTSEALRGSLGDLALRLNKYIGLCSGWQFHKEMSLFSDQLKHAIEQQQSSLNFYKLTCPHCSKGFTSQRGLDYHVEKKVCQKKEDKKAADDEAERAEERKREEQAAESRRITADLKLMGSWNWKAGQKGVKQAAESQRIRQSQLTSERLSIVNVRELLIRQ